MPNTLWLDLETTGLDPASDSILEIGMIVTTPGPEFAPIAEKNWILPYTRLKKNSTIHPVVEVMHQTNGLWKECEFRDTSDFSYKATEISILEWMDTHDAIGSTMHGATPSFDRSFLKEEFPGVEAQFHYRSFDVSTLKQFALFYDPEFSWMDREIHRAVPDL